MNTRDLLELSAEPEAVGLSSQRLARIGPAMERYVEPGSDGRPEVAGISAVIHRRGHTVYSEQFGFADREAGTEIAADTIFRIYSMTKPVVATALMLLFEEGLFRLDQPVAKYLPEFATMEVMAPDGTTTGAARLVTIRDLLTHTSGLTYDFASDSPVAELYRQERIMNDMSRTLAETVETLAALPLAAQPGQQWIYSVGIDVAARLIEVLSGKLLHEFLAERIFEPLAMSDTGFAVTESERGRLAAMYGLPDLIGRDYHSAKLIQAAIDGFNQRIDVSETYPVDKPEITARGGLGLFSTTSDFLSFARMLANRGRHEDQQILAPKTLDLMHCNHLRPELLPMVLAGIPSPGRGFGLGSAVMIDVAASGRLGSLGEFGWSGAAKTRFFVDPSEDLVAVFMTQYMTGVQEPDDDFRHLVYQALID